MDERLQQRLQQEFVDTGAADQDFSVLVAAACEGPQLLEEVLGGVAAPPPVEPGDQAQVAPKGAYLASVAVQGFRGVGDETSLDFDPGPGLTLVVGRNGSGKSSFAEGLEVLLTGQTLRWEGRTKVWQEGWRNLHRSDAGLLEAKFFLDGERGPTTVIKRWTTEELAEASMQVETPGEARAELESLGWAESINTYRPFLSYNELGSVLESPSGLYDAIAPILGLEDLSQAQKALADARLQREGLRKSAARSLKDELLPQIREVVDATGDERAARGLWALEGRTWDLDALEVELLETAGEPGDKVRVLQQLASLGAPAPDILSSAVAELRGAAVVVAGLTGTEAETARDTLAILSEAIAFHAAHGEGDCPVCRGARLDDDWKQRTRARITELESEAREAQRAHEDLDRATERARSLISAPPEVLSQTSEVGFNLGDLPAVWERWNSPQDDLANHIEIHGAKWISAVEVTRSSAAAELEKLQDLWRPISLELSAWLENARRADKEKDNIALIKEAEKWLKEAESTIRTERFDPIAQQTAELWELLRVQSSVNLESVVLTGSRTRRSVLLGVTIDGADSSALGVMSQGELHALALSLFLPRATLPQSPFRFIVIDDPVQSMDPARVDGLARVLERVGATHQVIVFTHDDRLPESVQRLGIKATVLAVTRRENSVVEIRESQDPVTRAIDDARALAHTKNLPEGVAERVVPGFCRTALEAAFIRMVRTRQLSKGIAHADIEDRLRDADRLSKLAALALFDDGDRGGDVMSTLNSRFGHRAGDAFKRSNRGAHLGDSGPLDLLVSDTEDLCRKLLKR